MMAGHGALADDVGELVEFWTLLDEDHTLLEGRRGATALGFTLLLKHYSRHNRFPRGAAEFSDAVVEFVARQVGVPAADLGSYEWSGSTIEYHRSQIRAHRGFRVATLNDQEKLTAWLAANVAHAERRRERVRAELLARFRAEQIEPPTPGRLLRMVRSALRAVEQDWTLRISMRLDPLVRSRLLGLIDADDEAEAEVDEDGAQGSDSLFGLIKSMPGNVSLESMMTEISKLEAVRAVGLPARMFADVAPKVMDAWRARAAVEAPSHLRRHAEPLTLTLQAALTELMLDAVYGEGDRSAQPARGLADQDAVDPDGDPGGGPSARVGRRPARLPSTPRPERPGPVGVDGRRAPARAGRDRSPHGMDCAGCGERIFDRCAALKVADRRAGRTQDGMPVWQTRMAPYVGRMLETGSFPTIRESIVSCGEPDPDTAFYAEVDLILAGLDQR